MVNKCVVVVYGCKSGYLSSASAEEKVSFFAFLFEKPDLLSNQIKFVNGSNWTQTENPAICIKQGHKSFLEFSRA